MTVGHLIKLLSNYDRDAEIVVGGCSACQASHDIARVNFADGYNPETYEIEETNIVVIRPRYAYRKDLS